MKNYFPIEAQRVCNTCLSKETTASSVHVETDVETISETMGIDISGDDMDTSGVNNVEL
jgi:hypothetical protein